MQLAGADRAQTQRSQRVVIVDMDHRVRGAMAELLEVAGAQVVGVAGDSVEAIDLLDDSVDILLVDPRLPDLAGGQALVGAVARDWPAVKVVIIGWSDAGDSRFQPDGAAFVTKSVKSEEFASAILDICGCPEPR